MALLKQWRDMAYDQEANKGDIEYEIGRAYSEQGRHSEILGKIF